MQPENTSQKYWTIQHDFQSGIFFGFSTLFGCGCGEYLHVQMLPPVISQAIASGATAAETKKAALSHLQLTHESRKLAGYAEQYAAMFHDLMAGTPLKEVVNKQAKRMNIDMEKLMTAGYDDIRVVHGVFGSACYIEDSFPVMLYLAYKYSDNLEKAVLCNTNVGGENCHRGAALGALMGAGVGESRIPAKFIEVSPTK